MNRLGFSLFVLSFSLLSSSIRVKAADSPDWENSFQLHGFVTQAFVKTDNNRFFGPSDKGSFEFTELGINASLKPHSDLLLTAQVLARRAGDMYDGSPAVDFALARWELYDDGEYQFGVSAGRLKNPIGLYNQTRDVAHTRPGILLPQVVYYDKVRNLELSGDGAAIHFSRFTGFGQLAIDYYVSKLLLDRNVEATFVGADFGGKVVSDGWTQGGQVRFTSPDEKLNLALSYLDTSMDFEPALTDPFGNGNTRIQFLVGSFQFNTGDWTITTEYVWEPLEWSGYDLSFPGAPQLDSELTVDAFYLQVERYLDSDVSLLARYGESNTHRIEPPGSVFPQYSNFSRILTLGVRWDITPRLMLRAEYANHNGTMILSNVENLSPASLSQHWNMLSVLASYRF